MSDCIDDLKKIRRRLDKAFTMVSSQVEDRIMSTSLVESCVCSRGKKAAKDLFCLVGLPVSARRFASSNCRLDGPSLSVCHLAEYVIGRNSRHRAVYGSMPGRIINAMIQAIRKPLILMERSTNWQPLQGGTLLRPCWRFWIRNRTTLSVTTTWSYHDLRMCFYLTTGIGPTDSPGAL